MYQTCNGYYHRNQFSDKCIDERIVDMNKYFLIVIVIIADIALFADIVLLHVLLLLSLLLSLLLLLSL